MLVLVLAGCSDPNRSKIVGIWEIESPKPVTKRLKGTEFESSITDDSRMRVEFQSDGILKTRTAMGPVNSQKEGRWELLSVDDPKSTIRIKCIIGLQETEHDIEILGPDTIKMVPPNMAGVDMKIRFKRTNPNF